MDQPKNGHFGKLTVSVRLARGALPVEGASVVITGAEEGEENVLYTLETDRSGNTPPVSLPAPPAENSLTPGHPGAVSFSYHVLTDKPGYIGVRNLFVPIYDGVTAIQNVAFVPLPEGAERSPYPSDVLRYSETDRPDL